MTKAVKISLAVVLLLSLCTMLIGYAQVTNTLNISGEADAEPQKNVFISNAVFHNHGYGDLINSYVSTVLNSTVNLTDDGVATINLTFYNNSAYVYKFNRVIETSLDNSDITYSLTNLTKGQEIQPQGTINASITFKYKSGTPANKVLNSILNFEFVPSDEYVDEFIATGGIDRFEQILNTEIDFDTLIDQMDSYSGNRNDSSYIGNVVGSSSADSAILNSLFTVDGVNYLKLNIGGSDVPVTAMVKRENVDGNSQNGTNGSEMTLYLTSEDPSDLPFWGGSLKVYAAVYTKDTANGQWYMVGQMYEGEASANNYEGGWGRNSFNTDTWKSTVRYYNQNTGRTIEQLTSAAPKGGVVISETSFPENQIGGCIIQPFANDSKLQTRIDLTTDENNTITINLLFYNRAGTTYRFDGVTIDTTVAGHYTNDNIIYTLTNLNVGDTIASHGTRSVSITFSYKDGVYKGDSELRSKLIFNFSQN